MAAVKEIKRNQLNLATARTGITRKERFKIASAGRRKGSEEKASFAIETAVTLTRFSRGIRLFVRMQNVSECHRLRAVFPNGIKTDTVLANGQFDIVERTIQTRPAWTWPTNEQRMQSFVALRDQENMLVVATRGLYEYEVLRDGSNTLCVNLLRCVDQLGDWGYFPAPEAQCMGVNTAEYAICIGSADHYDEAQQEAYQFASGDMRVSVITQPEGCGGEAADCLISMEGGGVWSTALKKWEAGRGVILRLYNTRAAENRVVLHTAAPFTAWRETDLLERPITQPAAVGGGISLAFAPKEIKTVLLTF